jgi:hypothetical protein
MGGLRLLGGAARAAGEWALGAEVAEAEPGGLALRRENRLKGLPTLRVVLRIFLRVALRGWLRGCSCCFECGANISGVGSSGSHERSSQSGRSSHKHSSRNSLNHC